MRSAALEILARQTLDMLQIRIRRFVEFKIYFAARTLGFCRLRRVPCIAFVGTFLCMNKRRAAVNRQMHEAQDDFQNHRILYADVPIVMTELRFLSSSINICIYTGMT